MKNAIDITTFRLFKDDLQDPSASPQCDTHRFHLKKNGKVIPQRRSSLCQNGWIPAASQGSLGYGLSS